MSAVEDFRRYFAECPLVAIIRGVTPAEAIAIAGALYDGVK
jgi:2-dehydro-3-deoxyphosphogalactonate aldolase